jgi:hypothetical protein
MGGISILPYRLRFYNDSAYYTTNEEFRYSVSYSIDEAFRLRICSVLSGVIEDEHLKRLHFGIWLPLLIIILRIYIDLTGGSDLEAISFVNQVRPYWRINPIPESAEEVILSQICRSADQTSAFRLLRLDEDGQSSCSSRMGAWVQFYFFQLLKPTEARLWLRHQKSLITIDLLAEELSGVSSRLWSPDQGEWGTSAGVRKEIKRRAEIWSQDNCTGLNHVTVETYDLTPYRIELDRIST